MAFCLMAHFAQQAHYVVDHLESEDMLQVQNIFDKTHQLFRQFVDTVYFLKEDNQKFRQLMPPHEICSEVLAKEYRLPFQYCIYILRHSFKRMYDMSEAEFKSIVSVYSKIFDDSYQSKIKLYDQNKDDKMDCDGEAPADDEWDGYDEFPYFDEVKFLQSKVEK